MLQQTQDITTTRLRHVSVIHMEMVRGKANRKRWAREKVQDAGLILEMGKISLDILLAEHFGILWDKRC